MNGSILIDYPVVATARPALGLVEVIKVVNSTLLVYLGVGAVDYYPLDILHGEHWF